MEDARIQTAAFIGAKFKMDPVEILRSDYFDWQVRNAAFKIVADAEKKAVEEMKSKAK